MARMTKTKLLVSIFLGIILVIVLLVGIIAYEFLRGRSIHDYNPTFQNSPIELAQADDGTYLFVKKEGNPQIGDKINYDIISVFQNTMQPVDNQIDEVKDHYVLIKLENVNVDCLGIYKNKELISWENISINSMPVTSDAWMCEGFDFKNALN